MDILLDTQAHDLVISRGDLVLVSGIDLVRQRLKQRLLTIRGEWFLDTEIGLPYFNELSSKGITEQRLRSIFIDAIIRTDDVTRLISFDLAFDRRQRTVVVQFSAETTFGPVEMTLP